jgi:periplasmic protein TonB
MRSGIVGPAASIGLALIGAMVTPLLAAGTDTTTPQENVDQQPVPLRITQPRYPPEAFRKGIGGTVELEILIDEAGRVAGTRVVKSVPGLDAAAIRCVKEWRFRPARKAGRPVSTIASAPVTFRITDKK